MNVQHFEKGVVYTDTELLLLAKKIGRLATYCKRLKNEGSSIRVEAERRETKKERDSVKVMMTVELPGKILRAESRRDNVIDAIDRCAEKLEPQLKRYKELKTARGPRRLERDRHGRGGDRRQANRQDHGFAACLSGPRLCQPRPSELG